MGVLGAEFFWNQWAAYQAARVYLAFLGRLPWRLEDFLRACHEANLLRQNGNHFIFRHQSLQASLAGNTGSRRRVLDDDARDVSDCDGNQGP